MDEIDCAWEHVEAFTAGALNATLTRRSNSRLSTGYCKACESSIEVERLRVNPYAQHCCDCAAEEEEKRQRMKRCGPII